MTLWTLAAMALAVLAVVACASAPERYCRRPDVWCPSPKPAWTPRPAPSPQFQPDFITPQTPIAAVEVE